MTAPPHVFPAGAGRVGHPGVAVEADIVPSVGALEEQRKRVALQLRTRVVQRLAEQPAVVGSALALEAAFRRNGLVSDSGTEFSGTE